MFRMLRLLARVCGFMARKLYEWENGHSNHAASMSHREVVQRTMTSYNMVTRPDEPYYARQYLHHILRELDLRFADRRLEILDLGCGQGRLCLPLADWCAVAGGRVTGVDFTPAAVEQAREYSAERRLINIHFDQADVAAFIQRETGASADVILLIEVAYVLPSYRQVLRDMARVLRPNGLMFVAFRSRYYNLLSTIRNRNWEGAMKVLESGEGTIFGGPSFFNWHDPDDIRILLNELGLNLLSLRGIGVCSGIEGDPLAAIARPSRLSEAEQEHLARIESELAERYAVCGRYILATAVKPPN